MREEALDAVKQVARSLKIEAHDSNIATHTCTLVIERVRGRETRIQLRLKRGTQVAVADILQELLVYALNINPVDVDRAQYE